MGESEERYAQKWCGHHNPRWEFAGVAVGVSMNSKSSEDSECVLAMMNDCMRSYNLRTGWQAFCIKVRNKWCYFSYERKWRWSNQLRDQVAGREWQKQIRSTVRERYAHVRADVGRIMSDG